MTFDAQPYGSMLGIIDSDPNVKLPQVAKDRGGNPRGIDVRPYPATGFGDLHLGSGFVAADMGYGTERQDTAVDRPAID